MKHPVPGDVRSWAHSTALPQLNLDGLATCHWVSDLPTEVIAGLAARGQLRSYRAGEALYRCGAMPEGVFGVREGSFKVVTGDPDGRDLVETVFPADVWFGEIFLFSGQRYFSDCIALEPASAMFIHKTDFLAFCERWPIVYRKLLAGMAKMAVAAIWLSAQYRRAGPELRLAHRLEVALQLNPPINVGEWAELRERLSHELLSQMLGLSRPRVTQAVQALTQAGIMKADRGRVRVHSARLRAYCLAGEQALV